MYNMNPLSGKTIFVQIAAYRDPELKKTLTDMFAKADEPESLHVCIAWQHAEEDEWDNIDEFANNPNINILDIDYKKAKGVCWARNKIQQHYKNEDFTLHLDSHHRFTSGWDTTLKNMFYMLQLEGYKKPLLTGYVPSYDPETEKTENDPWRLVFDRFAPEGPLHTKPETIPNWKEYNAPIASRFFSAHFCFTVGAFARDVQHDPKMYFHGEEISLAVRAYTHGYDLFHPHRPVIWHHYTRAKQRRHWDDAKGWNKLDKDSHTRVRKLLGIDGEKLTKVDKCKFNLGTERSLSDYEKYAGVLFSERKVQQYTLDNKYPPNTEYKNKREYKKSFLNHFRHCIDIGYDSVPLDDYTCWAVAFEDIDGNEIYRKDATVEEIKEMKNDADNYCKLWREFSTDITPYKWIVWPNSASQGWVERMEGIINPRLLEEKKQKDKQKKDAALADNILDLKNYK